MSSSSVTVPAPHPTGPRRPRLRAWRAYRVLVVVLASYASFHLLGLLRSRRRTEQRIRSVHRRNARRVEKAIRTLKGLFIKVGQLISIMTNFLPEAFRQELEGLQDQLPHRPFSEIDFQLRSELGDAYAQRFASIERTPLASASLAQVHEARLADGRRVAVKVQHADIDALVHSDLRIIHNIITIVQWLTPVQGLDLVYEQVHAMLLVELDFSKEAAHLQQIAANFQGDDQVAFPEVVASCSTGRILTTSFVEGIKVTRIDALRERGLDPVRVARQVVRAYCEMIFRHGLYHADPHPGNLFVRPDGRLVFIDFGAVAHLSPEMKAEIPRFIDAWLKRDPDQMAGSIRRMGVVTRSGHHVVTDHVLRTLQMQLLDDLPLENFHLKDVQVDVQTKLEVLGELNRLNVTIHDLMTSFVVPKDWVFLHRTLLLLMGLCTHLDPEMNPIDEMRPYLSEAVLGKDQNWLAPLGSLLRNKALTAFNLPDDLKEFLRRANAGQLELYIRGTRESTNLIYAVVHQFIYGMFALGLGTLAYVTNGNEQAFLSYLCLGGCVFFLLCLGVSMINARQWKFRP